MYRLSPQHVTTSFVGRDRDAKAVAKLLARSDVRIVTLTGPGGVGKTRLAFHVADAVQGSFEHGVVAVDLSGVTGPEFVLPAIADCFDIANLGTDQILDRLLSIIGDRSILFLLDNFEQVVDARSDISRLAKTLANACFLVTSRMPLHLVGEFDYSVSPLEVPTQSEVSGEAARLLENPAVALFVDRAQAVHRTFESTPDSLPTVARITELLDGLPLAIELAAARVKLFSLGALEGRLTDRLATLVGGPRDLPRRLQTMRNAITWSYDLLDDEERKVFRRVALFSGSFSYQAAEAVVSPPVSERHRSTSSNDTLLLEAGTEVRDLWTHLHSLIDKSLLQVLPDTRDDTRFKMMLTIQEFALEELDRSSERNAMRLRVLQYFSHHLVEVEELLNGPEQRIWMERLDFDSGNIRNALQTALDHFHQSAEAGLKLASTMWRYWLVRGQLREGANWLDAMLTGSADSDFLGLAEARAFNRLGNLRLDLGEHAEATRLYRKSLAIYRTNGHADGIADELNNLGLLQLIHGEPDRARTSLEESLTIRRDGGDATALPSTLANLGDVAIFMEELDLAESYHTEALRLLHGGGNLRRVAFSCYSLGTIAQFRHEFDRAQAYLDEGLKFQEQIDDSYTLGLLMLGLGRLNLAMGDTELGTERLRRSLQVMRRMGARRIMMEVIEEIASITVRYGLYSETARLLGSIHAARAETDIGVDPHSARGIERTRFAVAHALGDAAADRQFVIGERQTLEQAVSLGLNVIDEVRVLVDSGVSDPGNGSGDLDTAATATAARAVGLTRRERQVLVFLVNGASDKEIADELSIAPRTAMTHVANILSKLGVNRRTAAASVALRDGLVGSSVAGDAE